MCCINDYKFLVMISLASTVRFLTLCITSLCLCFRSVSECYSIPAVIRRIYFRNLCCVLYFLSLRSVFIVLVVRPVATTYPNSGSETVFVALIVSAFSLFRLLELHYTAEYR
jgi:hypothetical protein